jgi:DNA-binding transcriptional LysR family regulator
VVILLLVHLERCTGAAAEKLFTSKAIKSAGISSLRDLLGKECIGT